MSAEEDAQEEELDDPEGHEDGFQPMEIYGGPFRWLVWRWWWWLSGWERRYLSRSSRLENQGVKGSEYLEEPVSSLEMGKGLLQITI